MAVLVCIPTNSVRGFPFLRTFSSIYVDFWIAAILTGVKWLVYFQADPKHCFSSVMLLHHEPVSESCVEQEEQRD